MHFGRPKLSSEVVPSHQVRLEQGIASVMHVFQVLLRPGPCSNMKENHFVGYRPESSKRRLGACLDRLISHDSGSWSCILVDVKSYMQGSWP